MAYQSNRRRVVSIATLFLTLVTTQTALAVDCGGKAFHCENTTHFKICVDFGYGVSSTMDEFVIPCPPGTECQDTNHFECEFLKPTTLAPVQVQSDDTNDNRLSEEISLKNSSSNIEVVHSVSSDQHVTEHLEKILDSQLNTDENGAANNSSGVTETETIAFSYPVTMKPVMEQTTSAYSYNEEPYKLITTTATTAGDLPMVTSTESPELFDKVTTEEQRREPDEKVTESDKLVPMVTKSIDKVTMQPSIVDSKTLSHKQDTSVSEDVQENSTFSFNPVTEITHSTKETPLSTTVSEILPYTTNPYVTKSMPSVSDFTAEQTASSGKLFDPSMSDLNLNLANQNVYVTKSGESTATDNETTTPAIKTTNDDTLSSNILETKVPMIKDEYTLVVTTTPADISEELPTEHITVRKKIGNNYNDKEKFLIIVPEMTDTQPSDTNKTTLDEYFDSNYSVKGNINEAVDYISSLLHDSNFTVTDIQDELNVTTVEQLNLPDLEKISLILSKSERSNENTRVPKITESSLTSSTLMKHEKSISEHQNKYAEDYLQNDKQMENSTTTTVETLSSESEIIDQNTKDINTQLSSFILAITGTFEINEPKHPKNNLNTTEIIEQKTNTSLFNSINDLHGDNIKINTSMNTGPLSDTDLNASKPLIAHENPDKLGIASSNSNKTVLINSFVPVTENVNTYLLADATINDSNYTIYITNYTQNPDTELIADSETNYDAILRVKPLDKTAVNPQQNTIKEEPTIKLTNYEFNHTKLISDRTKKLKSTTEPLKTLNVTEKDRNINLMVVLNESSSMDSIITAKELYDQNDTDINMSPTSFSLDQKRDVKTVVKDDDLIFNNMSVNRLSDSKVPYLNNGLNIATKSSDGVELDPNKVLNPINVTVSNDNNTDMKNINEDVIPIDEKQKMPETDPYVNSATNERNVMSTESFTTVHLSIEGNTAPSRSVIAETFMNASAVENTMSQSPMSNFNVSTTVVTPVDTKLTSTEASVAANVNSSTKSNVEAMKNVNMTPEEFVRIETNMSVPDTMKLTSDTHVNVSALNTTPSSQDQAGNNGGSYILQTTQDSTDSTFLMVNYPVKNKTEEISKVSKKSFITTNIDTGTTSANTVIHVTDGNVRVTTPISTKNSEATRTATDHTFESDTVVKGENTTLIDPEILVINSNVQNVTTAEAMPIEVEIPITVGTSSVTIDNKPSNMFTVMNGTNTKVTTKLYEPTAPDTTLSNVRFPIIVTKEENVIKEINTAPLNKEIEAANEKVPVVVNNVHISTSPVSDSTDSPVNNDNGLTGIKTTSTHQPKTASASDNVLNTVIGLSFVPPKTDIPITNTMNTPIIIEIRKTSENLKVVNTTPIYRETQNETKIVPNVVNTPAIVTASSVSSITDSPAINNNESIRIHRTTHKPESLGATTSNNVVNKVTEPILIPTRTVSPIANVNIMNGVNTTPMSTEIRKSSQNAPGVVITVPLITSSPVPITKESTRANISTLRIVNTTPIISDIRITNEHNIKEVADTVITKEPTSISEQSPSSTTPIIVETRYTATVRTNKTNEIISDNTELNQNGSVQANITLMGQDNLLKKYNIIKSENIQGEVVTALVRTNNSPVPTSTDHPMVNRKIYITKPISTEIPVATENSPGMSKSIPIRTTRPLATSTQRPYTIPMTTKRPTTVITNANEPTRVTTQTITKKPKINLPIKNTTPPPIFKILSNNKTNSSPSVTSNKKNTLHKSYNSTGINTGHGIYPSPVQTKSNPVNKGITTSLTLVTSKSFNCTKAGRGRFSDKHDCRKFYICVDKHAIVGTCPANTVFSDIKKQCTKNLSHCIRNNEFKCIKPGRYPDMTAKNIYFICVKNGPAFVRFKFQCQQGFHLNKEIVKCIPNEQPSSDQSTSSSKSSKKRSESYSDSSRRRSASDPDSNRKRSESDADNSRKRSESDTSSSSDDKKSKERKRIAVGGVCTEEGKIPHPDNCRKYYICYKTKKSELRKRRRKCDSDEVFHKDKKKCVDADSYECQD